MPKVSKKVATATLQRLIDKGVKIVHDSPAHLGWTHNAETAVARIFGENSSQAAAFGRLVYITQQCSMVEAFLAEVEDFWEDDEALALAPPARNDAPGEVREVGAATQAVKKPCVFIGHGRSPVWAHLQLFLENKLGLDTINYESEPRAGRAIVPILEEMLERATFAALILTAEDETASGARRARQNVIHEAGLFQGKLGFEKAILLRQEGTEDFSNVAGLQYLSFEGDRIEQVFWQLQEVLIREGQVAK